jgi:proline iminopeptidase
VAMENTLKPQHILAMVALVVSAPLIALKVPANVFYRSARTISAVLIRGELTKGSDDINSQAGVIAVKGAKLHYVAEGTGVPCIVVGSSIMYPRLFAKELRGHLRLIFLDMPHFVPSEDSFDINQVTLDTYANDIEQVRTTLKLGTVVVMGHSIHGDLALEYARRYPQHVSHVVVIASPPVGMAEIGKASQAFWDNDASEERKRILKTNWEKAGGTETVGKLPAGQSFIKTYVTNGPKYWYEPTYDATWIWAGMDPNGKMTTHLFELFKNYDLRQGPEQIKAPVFLALGRYDYVVPYTTWDSQKGKLPNLSYNLFEKSGHTPQLEEAALFDQKLLAWLAVASP